MSAVPSSGFGLPTYIPGWFGAEDQGGGIAIADVNANGRPDLVVFHIDNPNGENHGYYRIGYDLSTGGGVSGWTSPTYIPGWFGAEDQGGGIAIADVNANGNPDLVVFHIDNPNGENHGYYRIGYDIGTSTLPPNGDADGDGLSNGWEQTGIDANNDGIVDLNLRSLGANPLHKDIFVEVDYMQFHRPNDQAIIDDIAAFANSPLPNPDGNKGISLHVQVNEQVAHQDTTDLAGLRAVKSNNFGTAEERSNSNHANIIAAKQQAYHYSLFVHSQPGSSSSGIAELPGMNFIVSLGAPGWGTDPVTGHTIGSIDQQEGTFMHELGHNLNLGHGGIDGINYKPNYLSVMSYAFQLSSTVGNRPLDYSRCAIDSLNENGLSEVAGIGASCPPNMRTFVCSPPPAAITQTGIPMDWNRDGDTGDTGVTQSVNCDTPIQILTGYNDWNNLIYRVAPGASGLEVPAQQNNITEELTVDDVRQHRLMLLDAINDAISKIPNSTFTQPSMSSNIKAELSNETTPTKSDLSTLLESDELDSAIGNLTELKTNLTSSLSANRGFDLIESPLPQNKVIPLIDNLITVLEKQK
jgi:hypothetical protein